MKILKFSVFLLLTIVLSIVACVQKDNQISPKDDLINHIGYWHNIAVELFFEGDNFTYGKTQEVLSYPEIKNIIMKELSKKNNELFNYDFIQAGIAWPDEVLKNNGIIHESKSDNVRKEDSHPINYSRLFKYLYEMNEISETLYVSFSDLNEKVFNNDVSRKEIIILSEQIKELTLSEKDKSYVDVFNQVLKYSNDFWGNTHAKMLDERTVRIIWADAAGALYGLLCGPVCSIIEAAAFSTLVAIQ